MKQLNLNGTWQLRPADLAANDVSAILAAPDAEWISQPVPGDIHQGLMTAGKITDPLVGLNSVDSQWTEKHSWWFKRTFAVPATMLKCQYVELELQGLDANAYIYLNGAFIGRHINSFYPFVADVKSHLRADGNNTLLVRLSTGIDGIDPADLATMPKLFTSVENGNGRPDRGELTRNFVRKPQYSFGWDWSPRVATTAIAGSVSLRAFNTAAIRNTFVKPVKLDKGAVRLDIAVTVDVLHPFSSTTGTVAVTILDPAGKTVAKLSQNTFLRSGVNVIEFSTPVAKPQLWWPNGLGDHPMYTARVALATSNEKASAADVPFGIRFVELDTTDKFAFIINGVKVFAKGANWIPADTIYARTTDAKLDELVRQAKLANFNMLRVWGGGLYEPDAFYHAADRYGIMIFHDFMFSCAAYPDHLDSFREQARREAEYQTTRLRNHPAIVVWSGSNECNWAFDEWFGGQSIGGAHIYNYILPTIVQRNCPNTPYWNGSPYGGEHPNCAEIGDRHHWFDCTMNPDMNKRITPEEYDKCTSLFISEYGYIGAPPRESVEAYLGGAPMDRTHAVWQHHTNTFEKNTVDAGITKHYADAANISLDEYFLYSGLVQGLMYGYSLESFRSRAECHGGLFWMYQDCWGEIGWTVIDCYLRRKPSWYFVRRAFAPTRLILRERKGQIHVILANDSANAVKGTLEFGRTSLDGRSKKLATKSFNAPAGERSTIATFKRDAADITSNLWIARIKNSAAIIPAVFRSSDFRQLKTPTPKFSLAMKKTSKNTFDVTVTSNVYAHAVHLTLPKNAAPSDDYFDLLPGESRTISVTSAVALRPQTITVSSTVNA